MPGGSASHPGPLLWGPGGVAVPIAPRVGTGGGWGFEKGTPRDVCRGGGGGEERGSWKCMAAPKEGGESRVRGPRRGCPMGVDARGWGVRDVSGGYRGGGRMPGERRSRSPSSSSFTSRAAFSPSSRRLRSIMRERSAAALSSALTVQPMAAAPRSALCRHCPALRGAGGAGRGLRRGRGFRRLGGAYLRGAGLRVGGVARGKGRGGLRWGGDVGWGAGEAVTRVGCAEAALWCGQMCAAPSVFPRTDVHGDTVCTVTLVRGQGCSPAQV